MLILFFAMLLQRAGRQAAAHDRGRNELPVCSTLVVLSSTIVTVAAVLEGSVWRLQKSLSLDLRYVVRTVNVRTVHSVFSHDWALHFLFFGIFRNDMRRTTT